MSPPNGKDVTSRSRGAYAPGWCFRDRPRNSRAQGMPDAGRTRSLACKEKCTCARKQPQGSQINRHSLRDGLRLIARSPRRPGLIASVALRSVSQDLIPASGNQDHTPLPSACNITRQLMRPRPPHPAPNVRDDREAPLSIGCETRPLNHEFPKNGSRIFFAAGLDRPNQPEIAHESRGFGAMNSGALGRTERRTGRSFRADLPDPGESLVAAIAYSQPA